MALRINTNVAALNAQRQLTRTTGSLQTSLERLSSGLRINSARDDAAGLAIAESFASQVRGLRQAQRNVQDGISLVQTAEGALSETNNILQRIRELAVQAANGTLSSTNRDAIAAEIDQLTAQIEDTSSDTQFNGLYVISGNSSNTYTIQAGAEQNQVLVLQISGANLSGIGIAGAISVGSASAASDSIDDIDSAINTVTSIRADLGAYQNRLEFSYATLQVQEENGAASESVIRDADIARETIDFTRNQILVSAGTSILAQANMMPEAALSLLV